jgi:hypothetical protein
MAAYHVDFKQRPYEDELTSTMVGLSPQNRVTTHAQVEILKWSGLVSYFYNSLPDKWYHERYHQRVKGYCGYHKAKDGRNIIFFPCQ